MRTRPRVGHQAAVRVSMLRESPVRSLVTGAREGDKQVPASSDRESSCTQARFAISR